MRNLHTNLPGLSHKQYTHTPGNGHMTVLNWSIFFSLQDIAQQLSAKEQETAELDAMLEEAQTESESHQAALRDCQDMLEELQTFSQGQESKLHEQQSQLQVQ